jgi:DMSO/TMAO reductase YedYZ molybdopterin-dependent catalytic subunit
MQDSQRLSGERSRRLAAAQAGRAGTLATLIMLAVQLIWRLNWSKDGVVQAFPEFVVAAVSRLTPLSVFGAATENYGSLAKKSLFAAVLIAIVGVGSGAGFAAGWLSRRFDRGAVGRLVAGMLVAAALWLVTFCVVMPIAHLGFFAAESSYTSDILVQITSTFALFGVLWTIFSAPRAVEVQARTATGELVSRRAVLSQGGWALATLTAALAVGGSAWRLINPRKRSIAAVTTSTTTTTTAGETTVQSIVATQRALQGHPLPTPTPADASAANTGANESASLRSDVPPATPADPIDLFAELDSEKLITPVLTEVDDFYHVSKNLTDPTVSKDGWTLKISGKVNNPMTFTLDQLTARATTQKITTLMCISNEINGDLTSTAQWTGVPLKDLLAEAGVQDGVVDIKLHAADDYEDSFPLERGLDPDTLVVVGMDGAPLRDDHGFPARIIVPGIYGMKNVKWLNEIELVDNDFMGYWQTRGWSDTAVCQIWGRIDQPTGRSLDPGPFTATGLAAAGDRDISRVEVSLDNGDTWADAMLEPSLNPPFTWVRWAFPFTAQPGSYTMKMRATDGTGQLMIEDDRDPLPDGATGWPSRHFKVNG